MRKSFTIFLLIVSINTIGQKQIAPNLIERSCSGFDLGGHIFGSMRSSDSGIIFNTVTQNTSGSFCSISKIDKNGNFLWKNIQTTNGFAADVIKYDSNLNINFYIQFNSNFDNTVVQKFDDDGNILANKTIIGFQATKAIKTLSGNIITVGMTDSGTANFKIKIVCLDSNLNILWQRRYVNYTGNGMDIGESIIELERGNFIVGCRLGSFECKYNYRGEDFLLMNLDSLGNVKWEKSYGGSRYDYFINMLKKNNNSFWVQVETDSYDGDIIGNHGSSDVFYGTNENEIWIGEINRNGEILRSKCIGNDTTDFSSTIIKTFDNNGLLLFGLSARSNTGDFQNAFSDTTSAYINWILRLDTLFNIQWVKQISGENYFSNQGQAFLNANGEIMYIGYGKIDSAALLNCTNKKLDSNWIFKFSADTIKPYPTIQGYIYTDYNLNNQKDSTEPYKANVKVQLSNGNYTYTDKNGFYQIKADSIGSYVLSTLFNGFYSLPVSFTFSSFDTLVNQNVALQPNHLFDSGSVVCLPLTQIASVGNPFPVAIIYKNEGTNYSTINASLSYDSSLLQFDSCNKSACSSNYNYINYQTLSTSPNSINSFICFNHIKSNAQIGDTLKISAGASVGSFQGQDSLFYIVDSSNKFNANTQSANKLMTITQLSNGDEIKYFVSFMNDGVDTTYSVIITDSLSNNVQANTFKMIASSHNCSITINNNVLKFVFSNINLPNATTNKMKSMGAICFSVKPKSNLAVGTTITNKTYASYNCGLPKTTIAKTTITGVLPVNLTSFTATPQQNKVLLQWQTATETNNNYFTVQRSSNKDNWQDIATIKGAGNSSAANRYASTDNHPLQGISYYRIKQTDFNGIVSYSEVRSVELGIRNLGISVYPIPASDALHITVGSKATLKIYNVVGKQMATYNLTQGDNSINIEQLSQGVYIAVIETATGVVTKKIIKE